MVISHHPTKLHGLKLSARIEEFQQRSGRPGKAKAKAFGAIAEVWQIIFTANICKWSFVGQDCLNNVLKLFFGRNIAIFKSLKA